MFRKKTLPLRTPHPDSRVEAQLQHVLAMYAAVHRTEMRLEDLRHEQRQIDQGVREHAGYRSVKDFIAQRAQLGKERAELEAFITSQHDDITKRLTDLGDDALYLGPQASLLESLSEQRTRYGNPGVPLPGFPYFRGSGEVTGKNLPSPGAGCPGGWAPRTEINSTEKRELMSHYTVTVCLDDKDGKLAKAARVATEGFPDGKNIPAFGRNGALLARVIDDRLAAILAPYDENRETGPYRDYQEGGPEDYWLYLALKEADENERGGKQETTPFRSLPEQAAKEAALFRTLPEPVTWESLIDAVAILYPDEDHSLRVGEDGRAYSLSTYNPDSKWDWYAVGGRWAGRFVYRPGFAAEVLNPDRGWVPGAGIGDEVTEGARPLHCNGGRKRALDLKAMRDAAEASAREEHAEWRALTDGLPEALPWRTFADNISENGYTVEQAREQYSAQPRIRALEGSQFGDPFGGDAVEKYQMPEEVFVNRARAAAVPGWAVLTTDGRWTEKGRMGWFAVSDATEGSTVGYLEAANSYLDSLPDSTWLVTVDCHI